jgi:hypothetical protein
MWEKNKYLRVGIEIPKGIPEEYILRELSQKIAEEIIEKQYYILEKNEIIERPFNNTKIQYEMYVALDPKINQNSIKYQKGYKINDVEFSDEEIYKALVKTYPYKLI